MTDDKLTFSVYHGDALEWLKTLPDNSADSLVTDPPSGIGFMNRKWDGDKGGMSKWIAWLQEIMEEVLRVLKPGAHGLVWAIPRTSHWTGTALELAGFNIRDKITHIFGSGMPHNTRINRFVEGWDGWGSAIKPGHEDWWLIQKPLEKGMTIASNVVKWKTGALNIDAARVSYEAGGSKASNPSLRENIAGGNGGHVFSTEKERRFSVPDTKGRWPSNVVYTHSLSCDELSCSPCCPVKELDQQSGVTTSGVSRGKPGYPGSSVTNFLRGHSGPHNQHGGTGGASRYFHCFRYMPKPGRGEREAGLDHIPLRSAKKMNEGGMQGDRDEKAEAAIKLSEQSQGLDARGRTLIREDGTKTLVERFIPQFRANNHNTLKSIELMRFFVRLLTPRGGTVIDPFTGSGTTGCGSVLEGCHFKGSELDEADENGSREFYPELARERIKFWRDYEPEARVGLQVKDIVKISNEAKDDSTQQTFF